MLQRRVYRPGTQGCTCETTTLEGKQERVKATHAQKRVGSKLLLNGRRDRSLPGRTSCFHGCEAVTQHHVAGIHRHCEPQVGERVLVSGGCVAWLRVTHVGSLSSSWQRHSPKEHKRLRGDSIHHTLQTAVHVLRCAFKEAAYHTSQHA